MSFDSRAGETPALPTPTPPGPLAPGWGKGGIGPRTACSGVLLGLLIAACGGPNLQFDPSPSPSWVRGAPEDSKTLHEVGQAPATVNVQRDAELATRDAQNRIAQRFASQVVSRSSDWAVAVASGDKQHSGQVVSQDIEIRSNVRVEGARVTASYRDEATKTQYILVGVDRQAWADTVRARVNEGSQAITSKLDEAERALTARRALAALQLLAQAREAGASIEGDVLVLELLQRDRSPSNVLATLRGRLATLDSTAREKHPIRIEVRCTDAQLGGEVARAAETFLKSQGLSVASGGILRAEFHVEQRFVRVEKVANRQEQVYAAAGSLRVLDGDGSELGALAVTLPETNTERDVQAEAAKAKALKLAADTLVAQFRSRVRTALLGSR